MKRNRNKHPQPSAVRKPGLTSRLVATQLLTRVIDDRRNLDALCDRQHGLKDFLDLSQSDQALARAIAVIACRNRVRISSVLSKVQDRPPPKRARFLFHSLHVAVAQLLFMDVPQSAAVDLAVTAIGDDPRTSRFRSFANAILRRVVREREDLLEVTSASLPFSDWMEKTLRKDYGRDKLGKIATAVSNPPNLDITVKSDPVGWANKLAGKVLPNGSIRLTTSSDVRDLEGFDAGEWWVQDAAASIPATLVTARPAAKVLELCAAPGGKTAQLVNSGFDVTALDISAPRLKRLKENLDRLQLEAKLIEADILEWEPAEKFDAVLLDAPCSSTGTVRRHPDVLWTKTRSEVTELAGLQFALLKKASTFVKPGGIIVFSNCSMMKEEGEDLLAAAITGIPDLQPDPITSDEVNGQKELINGQGAVRSLPFHFPDTQKPEAGGLDGFFACRFIKG